MPYKAPHPGIRLLIVDDDHLIRKLVTRIALSWQYEVEDCASAEDALQLLQRRRFEVILSDIRMGEMDGLTLARSIRHQMPETPVIIMSGNPVPDPLNQTEAIYYIQKPVSMDKLGVTLQNAVEWNIDMLITCAVKSYTLQGGNKDHNSENHLRAVKDAIRAILLHPGSLDRLRKFVCGTEMESTLFLQELNRHLLSGQ